MGVSVLFLLLLYHTGLIACIWDDVEHNQSALKPLVPMAHTHKAIQKGPLHTGAFMSRNQRACLPRPACSCTQQAVAHTAFIWKSASERRVLVSSETTGFSSLPASSVSGAVVPGQPCFCFGLFVACEDR